MNNIIKDNYIIQVYRWCHKAYPQRSIAHESYLKLSKENCCMWNKSQQSNDNCPFDSLLLHESNKQNNCIILVFWTLWTSHNDKKKID